MAITNKENLISRLTAIIGEDKNDDAISLVEDLTDTIGDFEAKTKDETKWKERYEENDREWRNKYIERFKKGVITEDDEDPEEEEHVAPRTYEELFSVKEK